MTGAAVTGWIETQRSAVVPADTDELGHMNVAPYVTRFSQAAMGLSAALGLTPDVMREARRGISTVRQRVRYLAELRLGDVMHVQSGIAQVGNKSLTGIHRMLNTETGAVAATMEQTMVLLDLDARRGVAWPDQMREKARALDVGWNDPPTAYPTVPEGATNFRDTYRGVAMPWEMDMMGHLSIEFYMQRFSMAVGQTQLLLGLTREVMQREAWGLAAMEYLLTYRRECRPGDMLRIVTGVTDIGGKSMKLQHRMLDGLTGAPVAAADEVVVLFSTRERRGVPLPDAVRAKAQAMRVA